MTTESRMREALEKIEQKIVAVKGHLGSGEGDFISGLHAAAAILREALSPPARGTSMEWQVDFWNAVDQWARARYEPGSKSTIRAEKAVVEVHKLIDDHVANLTPPEEKA